MNPQTYLRDSTTATLVLQDVGVLPRGAIGKRMVAKGLNTWAQNSGQCESKCAKLKLAANLLTTTCCADNRRALMAMAVSVVYLDH